MVEELDCTAMYGEGSNREPDAEGNCVCAGNTSELGGTCMESQFFFLIIFALVALAMAVIVFFYLGYKKKQNGMLVLLAVSFSCRYDVLLPLTDSVFFSSVLPFDTSNRSGVAY